MAIYGVAEINGKSAETGSYLEAMSSAMHGRGPRIRCSDQHAGLGASSALGTASVHSDEHLMVVCDAEIYNLKDLSERSGRAHGNISELIAALYVEDGESFLQQLHGPFALAIWDKQRRQLLLARDRIGIKPLCYAEGSGGFVFASDPRGILATRLVPKRVNHRALVDYLNFNVVPAPLTAYEGITKLRPAESLIWQKAETRRAHYWKLQYTEDARGSEQRLTQELFAHLENAVRVTSADLDMNQTGCFLSGGTDSSSIAALFSRARNQPSSAFSIGFAEKRFDELQYARLAAQHFDLVHHTRILESNEAYDLIPKIVDIFDEPFANASAIPTYACVELAKQHGISTLLAGDGGDELFGGNERYRIHQVYDLYQRIPRTLRKLVEPALFATPVDRGVIGKAKAYIRRSNTPNPERYCRWRLLQVFPSAEILGDAMPSVNGNSLAVVRAHHVGATAHSELNRLLYIDIKMTLGDEDLPKVVRTAEAVGVNARFPFLYHPLVEFSGRLPVRMKVKGFEKRYLFKRATQGLLPDEILKKKKHGFGLPIGMWLKTDPKLRTMARDVLLSPVAYQRGYFRRAFIEQLMSHLEADNTPYYGDLLWVFLMLELWHRRHVEGAA